MDPLVCGVVYWGGYFLDRAHESDFWRDLRGRTFDHVVRRRFWELVSFGDSFHAEERANLEKAQRRSRESGRRVVYGDGHFYRPPRRERDVLEFCVSIGASAFTSRDVSCRLDESGFQHLAFYPPAIFGANVPPGGSDF